MSELKLKTTETQRNEWSKQLAVDCITANSLIDDIDTCLAEIERLREALQFYADLSIYNGQHPDTGGWPCLAERDNGQRAREALK